MSTTLEVDMVSYVSANIAGLTPQDNLWAAVMPDEPINSAALIGTPGAGPQHTMGKSSLPPLLMPRLQCQVRNDSHAAGELLIRQIWDLLSVVANQQIGSNFYYRIESVDEPSLLLTTPRGERIFNCNWQVTKSPSNA